MFEKKNNSETPIIQSSDYRDGVLFRICTKCNREKPISDFGLRKMGNGEIRNQAQYKKCR